MVQNTFERQNSLGSLVGENDTASTNSAITPTTNKFLTELFESENCVDKLETIEKEGFLVPLPPVSVSAAPNANKETSNQNLFFPFRLQLSVIVHST